MKGSKTRPPSGKTPHPLNEAAIIKRISLVGIVGNIVLSAFKLFAGIVGHSNAMVSDAVHSLSDVFTTFIAFLGVRMSKKGPDKEHPYGHDRTECVASLVLGIILLATGLGIGQAGLRNIFASSYEHLAVPGAIALAAAIVSIVVKEAMYWYTRHYAILLNSSAFMADAWHHRSDAFSSIGSLIGIAGAMLGWPILDSVASLVICVFILKVAYDILKDALRKMLDTSCGEEYEKKITDFVLSLGKVVRVDMIHTRMFGNKVYIDLEVAMDGNKTLEDTHSAAEAIHKGIETQFSDIKHVMIHVNPA